MKTASTRSTKWKTEPALTPSRNPRATLHAWPRSARRAIEIQNALRDRVERRDRLAEIRYLAGLDVGMHDRNRITRAAIAVLSYPELELCDQAVVDCPTRFPYVPGLLSFREVPALLRAFERLTITPDLLLCDAHGYAHPRRFGLACHLGVLLDLPSIGVAKSRLIGTHRTPGTRRGARARLVHDGETIGAVVRTRTGVQPVYVSIGHRVGLDTAVRWVLAAAPRYRLPETTRAAHRLASVAGGPS